MEHSQIRVGAIDLHVVELGSGKPVLFCHGFPDLWRGWRLQMEAIAAAGYRAIALDMRGYGRSSAPEDPLQYTPLHTVGDLVGLIDALGLPEVTIVGHDFGANVAWNAALMRPDRFAAVFGMSVPYLPRGDLSFIETLRKAGRDSFYMFSQMRPESDNSWANAAITYPSVLYWTSGSPPPEDRWNPFDTERAMTRKAPVDIPPWADPEDVAYAVAEFQRTGFRGGLNYYRSIQSGFDLTAPFKGALIRQPSFFLVGELDGLNSIRPSTEAGLRQFLPGLRGFTKLPDIGHWPQREAPEIVNAALLGFLGGLT
ncbi:alpha/beta fold hydrolase [Roseixanthobacter glucoisosaccharinicivorans]|uniref:alpha/beta fold hydrolase n=1 Tax=Roseixanthobacter glucoisosaccharinicivorans TaxID=3119923 RepID=UPI0037295197